MNSQQEQSNVKIAKSNWRKTMTNLYPKFQMKQWGRTKYRINHPQSF